MKHLLTTTALLALTPTWAMAATVYPGCAVPTVPPKHNTFFVDPAKGSNKGDGSAAKPWRVLSEVLFNGTKLVAGPKNPTGPIKPGDVIMLKNGDHGDVKFTGLFNSDFISVLPAPGQTPTVQSLSITSSGKWSFQGLKFMPGVSKNRAGGIIAVGYGDWQGATQDIVLDNNSVLTVENTSSWTDAAWQTNAQSNAIWTRLGTKCVSVTNNHIYNVFSGVGMSSSDSVIQGNVIESIANDGIDIISSNLLVKGNIIKGGTNSADSKYHADGIQGWSPSVNGVQQTNRNVTIDGNTIIKFGNFLTSYMQGISIFDGKWDNLVIQNNAVAVNHFNAITLMGVQNSRIVNNTVMATEPTKAPSWIMVRAAKDGTPSNNVIVRNNLATQISAAGNKITVDHNFASASIGLPGVVKALTAGTGSDGNRVVANLPNQFVSLDAANQRIDLHLKSSSSALGAGNPADMPTTDLTGKARKSPPDLGAYAK